MGAKSCSLKRSGAGGAKKERERGACGVSGGANKGGASCSGGHVRVCTTGKSAGEGRSLRILGESSGCVVCFVRWLLCVCGTWSGCAEKKGGEGSKPRRARRPSQAPQVCAVWGGASHAGHALKKRGGENTNTHKTRLAWRVQHALRATRAKTREQGGREGGSSRHTHKHHYSACAREARERREGGDKRARAHTD